LVALSVWLLGSVCHTARVARRLGLTWLCLSASHAIAVDCCFSHIDQSTTTTVTKPTRAMRIRLFVATAFLRSV